MKSLDSQPRRTPQSHANRCVWVLVSAVVFSVVAFAFCLRGSRGDASYWTRYQRQAESAAAAHQFEIAQVCYERLLRHDPDDRQSAFGLAMAYDALGRHEACVALITRLTMTDDQGYPPADLYVAEQLLNAKAPTAQDRDRAQDHLRKVLQADPTNAEALLLLSTLRESSPPALPPGDR